MRYTFLYEDKSDTVTHSFYAETVTEMCEKFQQFLAGCGFFVAAEEIQYTPAEDPECPKCTPLERDGLVGWTQE